MAEPTKQETEHVFKVLKAHKSNKVYSHHLALNRH